MKPKQPTNEESDLSALLWEWREEAPLPPGFRDAVWRRIGQAKPLSAGLVDFLGEVAARIGLVLSRPALAVSYLLALSVLGATVGWAQSQHRTSRVSDELSHRYVRALDPYQSPH